MKFAFLKVGETPRRRDMLRKLISSWIILAFLFSFPQFSYATDKSTRKEKRKQEIEELQRRFEWWPTDAKPSPVKDPEREGYWWWPTIPGKIRPWGNRGYVYVYKIIFDYKAEELPPPKPKELRPSLLIKKIIKNVKVYFDFDKADLRTDHIPILNNAVKALKGNPEASILITGSADRRGSEAYNEKLGRRRAEVVKKFMVERGIAEDRIRIVSRGKLDAVAPITDLVGMQKDRNAQFMIAEVEEAMLPYEEPALPTSVKMIEEGKYLEERHEKVESEVKVTTKEYTVQKGDSLSGIAKVQLGSAHRWKYLYELNKGRIKNPDNLKAGQKILIPVE